VPIRGDGRGARDSMPGAPTPPALVSLAKARCSDAAIQVANEAIQMHGGIGMTDEHEIGFYLKRARVAELTLGRQRVAPRALGAPRRLLADPRREADSHATIPPRVPR
jgi:alkylation response protein AidB-like acyl-CoA dehydrogenase